MTSWTVHYCMKRKSNKSVSRSNTGEYDQEHDRFNAEVAMRVFNAANALHGRVDNLVVQFNSVKEAYHGAMERIAALEVLEPCVYDKEWCIRIFRWDVVFRRRIFKNQGDV